MRKSKTVCFCGHRTGRLPKGEELQLLSQELFAEVDRAVQEGYTTFMFGGNYGFDLIAARQVILRKRLQRGNIPDKIELVAVIPFEEQANDWKESNRREYFDILAQCDDCITLCPKYSVDCWMNRNKFMINHSSKMICYYNGGKGLTGYSVFYAKAKRVEIVNLYEKEKGRSYA